MIHGFRSHPVIGIISIPVRFIQREAAFLNGETVPGPDAMHENVRRQFCFQHLIPRENDMSEQQKNGTSQDEAADEAKLEDKALDDVQGGIYGQCSYDPTKIDIDMIKENPEQMPPNSWELVSP